MSTLNGGPRPNIVTSGMVLHLDAGNPASYPGSGTTWTDLSGQGNNASLSNVGWDSQNGGRMILNNSSINFPVNNNTRLLNNYQTINQWVKVESVGPNGYAELWSAGDLFSTLIGVQLVPTRLQFNVVGYIQLVSSGQYRTVNTLLPLSTWFNITTIIDRLNGVMQIYNNGLFAGSNNITSNYSVGTQSVQMGSNWLTYNTDAMNGSIATTFIYNRILSSSEVFQNYYALKERFGL